MTQSLDVGVFLSLKTRYKTQVQKLTAWRDTAEIKKITFVQVYADARKDALSERNIRAGYRKTGIVPLSIEPLLSSRHLRRTERPQTPPRSILAEDLDIVTPQKSQDLDRLVRRLRTQENIGPRLHSVLVKAGKALDIQYSKIVRQSGELEAQRQIEEERARTKAALVRVNNPDPNLIFQDPDTILATMQLEQEITAARQAEAAVKASGGRRGKGKGTTITPQAYPPEAVLPQAAFEHVWKLQDMPFNDDDDVDGDDNM